MGAHRGGRPQFSSPGEPSSPPPPWSLVLGKPTPAHVGKRRGWPWAWSHLPGPLRQAPFQVPVSAQVRWGFFASYPATPLGRGFGFRVQTGLHSSEGARSPSSKLRNQQDVSLPCLRAPRGIRPDRLRDSPRNAPDSPLWVSHCADIQDLEHLLMSFLAFQRNLCSFMKLAAEAAQ